VIKIILMLIKLIYLVSSELTSTKLKPYSLSREISFLDRARIIEFGPKVGEAVLQYLVAGLNSSKMYVSCHNVQFGQNAQDIWESKPLKMGGLTEKWQALSVRFDRS
jgi:hypothetical protein